MALDPEPPGEDCSEKSLPDAKAQPPSIWPITPTNGPTNGADGDCQKRRPGECRETPAPAEPWPATRLPHRRAAKSFCSQARLRSATDPMRLPPWSGAGTASCAVAPASTSGPPPSTGDVPPSTDESWPSMVTPPSTELVNASKAAGEGVPPSTPSETVEELPNEVKGAMAGCWMPPSHPKRRNRLSVQAVHPKPDGICS
jgi:hypothetical protein